MKHKQILEFLEELRDSHTEIENIFLCGSCLNLFCMLKALNPTAVAWFSMAHIITEINGKFYDITGEVSNKGYYKFKEYYQKKENIEAAFLQIYRGASINNFKN